MILEKLKLIFTEDEIARITVDIEPECPNVTVDVHGLKCRDAKRLINNIINLLRVRFQLKVIHGYNHGTAIKNMLATNYTNSHVRKKYLDTYNQGVTYMVVA